MEELESQLKEFEYGWMDKDGNKQYHLGGKFNTDYRLQTKEEMLKNKIAICFDIVELERNYMEEHNIDHKSIMIHFNSGKIDLVHTFLIYFEGKDIYYMEYAFKDEKSTTKFNDMNTLLDTVKERFIKENKISIEGTYTFLEYSKPVEHATSPEFLTNCAKGKIINR